MDGTCDFRAAAYDAAGNSTVSTGPTRSVSNPLTGQSIAAGNQDGIPVTGDTLVFTYSRAVDLSTISIGWIDPLLPQPVSMVLKDRNVTGAGTGKDRIEFSNAALGLVAFNEDYVTANTTTLSFTGTMTATTNGSGQSIVTVLITGAMPVGVQTDSNGKGSVVWTPSSSVKAPNGTACSIAAVTEFGSNDKDF